MMMIPRSFASSPSAISPSSGFNEKQTYVQIRSQRSPSLGDFSPAKRKPSTASRQYVFNGHHETTRHRILTSKSPHVSPKIDEPSPHLVDKSIPQWGGSAQDIISSTAIPIRRKPRQRPSQRIPDGDYVAEFSRLLLDDVRPTTASSLSSSLGNPHFDGLFGNIDGLVEGQMIVGSEGLDRGMLSARSLSSDSMVSLASPEDFSVADTPVGSLSMNRSVSDRRIKQLATSQECMSDHPLVSTVDQDDPSDGDKTPALSIVAPPKKNPLKNRMPSTFKSSLTASLKAIKSAAQSVSSYAISASGQPDDFGGNGFFDFDPTLTDDRRPPPSDDPPSPALRRYLNPHHLTPADSPAQLHFWIEQRSEHLNRTRSELPRPRPKIKKSNQRSAEGDSMKPLPIVPLATCIPSQIRTAHASSPPIWLGPDGSPLNKQTAAVLWDGTEAGLRQCEPRENSDFLRIYVCEMQMRKAKKLRDDIEGRAKMWLPPVERARRRSRPASERLHPQDLKMM